MRIADVMVHNAGGMSFSESLVAGLPAVTFRCIPGHGRANGEVLARAGVAPMADTVEELAEALRTQLRPDSSVVLRTTVAAAGDDAGAVVLHDLRTRSAAARARARRARRRYVSVRRRISAVGAVAVVAATSLAATEGVAAATRHGFGVARMPAHSVALIVAPDSLRPLQRDAPQLAAAHASVLVPDRLTPRDVTAARTLAAAGVPVLARGCAAATLISHATAQRCGASSILAKAGLHTSRIVVSDGHVDGPALVVARRDDTRIVIGEAVAGQEGPAGTATAVSGVWVLHQRIDETRRELRVAVDRQVRRATAAGLELRPVTDAVTGG
jgi:hypothetical protein